MRVGIVGSGLCGLACARQLSNAGLVHVIFDKGRGPGGRLATRRADQGRQFDHGAQYLTARNDGFAGLLAEAENAGAVARWRGPRYVGVPGMNALAKYLAAGLDVRQNTEVRRISQTGDAWEIVGDAAPERFDCVVSTAPAPQTRALLGKEHPVSRALEEVRIEPCWTLLLALAKSANCRQAVLRNPGEAIAWLAEDSSKPGRSGRGCWVAQANPDWSKRHLELGRPEIVRRMLSPVCATLGVDPSDVTYASAHRWRYALASRPLGQPFAANSDGTFFAGGDWTLGARAEAAWQSGTAIADAILRTL